MTNVELPCRKVVIKPLLLFLLLLLLLLSLIIICNPFRGHSRNISKCLANRLPVWRVDVNCNESFDSSRIKLIRQNLQLPFVATCGIFSECLTNRLLVWRVDFNWNESFDSTTFSTTLDSYLRNILSRKLTSGMRFHLMRDGLSDSRYNETH